MGRQAQSRAKRKREREKLLRSPTYRRKIAEHIAEKMRMALGVPIPPRDYELHYSYLSDSGLETEIELSHGVLRGIE